MKSFIRKTLAVAACIAATIAIAVIVTPSPSQAQVAANPRLFPAFTNAITFTNMGTSNVFNLGAPIALVPGKGFSVQVQFAPDNSALITSNNSLCFAVSADGTNYGLNPESLICLKFAPLATVATYPWSNFPASVVGNATSIRAAWFTNGNNATAMVSRITNALVLIDQ